MAMYRTPLAALIGASLLLAAAPLLAQGASVAEDLESCRELVAQEKWKEAVAAYRKLFEDHEGDPAIRRGIRDIEDNLKRALFRCDYEPPTAKDLFGDSVTYFGKGSLKIKLEYKAEPVGPFWEKVGSGLWVLNLRFRDKVSLDMVAYTRNHADRGLLIYLCYDIEKNGGYVFCPGASWETARYYHRIPRFIGRLDDGEIKMLVKEERSGPSPGRYKVSRESTTLRLYSEGKQVARVSDRTYKGGYVAFVNLLPESLTIEGRLDEDFYRRIVGTREDEAFREWLAKGYDREEEIPEWARSKGGAAAAAPITLPSDATTGLAESIGDHLDGALEGDEESAKAIEKLAGSQFGENARTYLEAIAAIGYGELDEAEKKLGALIGKEPAFAPAVALRGLVRIALRKLDEASRDLAAARRAAPKLDWPYLGQANLAIYRGDLQAALDVLAAAKKAGAASEDMEKFAAVVHRASRGPLWSTRYEVESTHFVVRSDHSKDMCKDTAKSLEAALASYARHLPDAVLPDRKSRVYVFSNREGFLGYGKAVSKDLAYAAGAYDPSLRELVLFVPVNRKHLLHTIRHEGFHRFLHEFLDDAPLWFNEGCAEYFASGRERFGGGLAAGAPNEDAIAVLKALKKELTPLEELFLLKPRAFMAKAPIHYPQAWAVIHFLKSTKDPDLKGVLMRYFQDLREGRSQQEAYERTLKPVVKKIQAGYLRHALSLED